MPKIIITGTFNGSSNNFVILEVYKSNPGGFDFRSIHRSSFKESTNEFKDLVPGNTYIVDVTGHTTGSFTLSVTGDVVREVTLDCNGIIDNSATFTVK